MPDLETSATIFFGMTALVLSVLGYRLQKRAQKTESRLKELEYQAASIELEQAKRALLEPYLQHDPGPRTFVLSVRNLGKAAALNVVVDAEHDSGSLRTLVTFPSIAPGAQQNVLFTNHDWQVIGGSSLGLQLEWDDGSGHHSEVSVATLRR